MSGGEGGPAPLNAFTVAVALVFAATLIFTAVLVAFSFPAGVYTFFFTRLSQNYTWATLARPYVWVGPLAVWLPPVALGASFLAAVLAYALLFIYAFVSQVKPAKALLSSLRSGLSSFFTSPFWVSLASIGFLVFTASLVDTLVSGTVAPQDPLAELWSLTYAPLVEEVGFRVVMIGVVAAILSLDRGVRGFLKSLWRPAAAYEGRASPGTKYFVVFLMAMSSLVFGYEHVLGGWTAGKLVEATYGGVVLAYLYVKYGFYMSVLAHWGIDYFASVYSFFGQGAYGIPWDSLTRVYVLQEAVNLDLLLVVGLASFLVVAYLGLVRLTSSGDGGARESDADKTPLSDPGSGI